METAALLEETMELLDRLGAEVRLARLGGGGGGLCRVKGRAVVLVDLEADAATRLDRCVHALAEIGGAQELYMSSALRMRVETHGPGKA
jgi:hypothetical protein